jgi:histidine triad (HIT) family protein
MVSVFSKIANNEIPCHKIAEDEFCMAFLDISPLAEGHTLVIPKKEVDNIFDLDAPLFQHLFAFAQKVAIAIARAIPCKKVGIAVIGLEVPHAHIHLVPINSLYDIDFSKQKLTLSAEQLQVIAEKIRSEISSD